MAYLVHSIMQHRVRSALRADSDALITPGGRPSAAPTAKSVLDMLATIQTIILHLPAGRLQRQLYSWNPNVPKLLHLLRVPTEVYTTIIGAVVAWFIGMVLGSSAGPHVEEDTALLAVGAAVLGLGLGALLGLAQWFVLRRHLRQAGWWVPANATAWAVGMVVAFAGTDVVQQDALVPAAVVRGTSMGVLVGAIHGGFLVWLLRRQ